MGLWYFPELLILLQFFCRVKGKHTSGPSKIFVKCFVDQTALYFVGTTSMVIYHNVYTHDNWYKGQLPLKLKHQIYSRLTLRHILYATILTNQDRLSGPTGKEEPILASHGWICCYSVQANWKLCFSVFIPNGAIWFPLRISSSIPIYFLTLGIVLTHMT